MFRSVIAAALSLALVLPLTAAPAHAQLEGRHAAQIVGGLAALYVLKEALERRDATPAHRSPSYRAPARRAPQAVQRGHGQPRHSPAPRRAQVRRVPDQCGRNLNTSNGRVLAYDARCMQRNVARPRALPPQCIRQVRTNRGTQTVYGRGCLRREGWAMAAR